ncbi:hypothetical protein ACSBOB_13325 [Mesorhizobium sp. ASY16-5R]|uniref:hypothetical protein n=1 Tax=Mesorhizobium sp. ASY16-5R TaxID=3445772 RepID=UPI003FA1740F
MLPEGTFAHLVAVEASLPNHVLATRPRSRQYTEIALYQPPANDCPSAETVPPTPEFQHAVNPCAVAALPVNSIQGRENNLHCAAYDMPQWLWPTLAADITPQRTPLTVTARHVYRWKRFNIAYQSSPKWFRN